MKTIYEVIVGALNPWSELSFLFATEEAADNFIKDCVRTDPTQSPTRKFERQLYEFCKDGKVE